MATEMPIPAAPQKTPKAVMWAVIVIVIAAVIGLSLYVYIKDGENGNSNANTNSGQNFNNNLNSYQNVNTGAYSNSNSAVSSNAAQNVNASPRSNVNTTGWKAYTNTKFGYSIKLPQSWAHIVEFDGSLEYDLNKDNIQEAVTLSLGPSDKATEAVFIQVSENKTLDQFLKDDSYTAGTGATKFILDSSDFTTSSGIRGKRVDLVSSVTGYDFAYVFPKGSSLVDFRFRSGNTDALGVINTLTFKD